MCVSGGCGDAKGMKLADKEVQIYEDDHDELVSIYKLDFKLQLICAFVTDRWINGFIGKKTTNKSEYSPR